MRSKVGKRLKIIARLHFWMTFFVFVAYLIFGFSLGPGFFKKDLLTKLHTLADDIVVSATVLGGPATPLVTATPSCVSGAPRITLDWADDAATDTWDIERDSLPLVTGLIVSQYIDTAVTENISYSYVVTAYGPMFPGSAASSSVSATALDCAAILPPATVTIQTLGGRNVSVDRTGIELSRRRPQVTGTTNVANALVTLSLTNPSMQATTTANANGYFSWVPPARLDSGNHILSVTVTDPNDVTRTASDSFIFKTFNDGGEEGSDEREETIEAVPAGSLDFFVRVNNGAEFLFQGDEMTVGIYGTKDPFPVGTVFRAFIVDASGREIFRLPETTIKRQGQTEASLFRTVPLLLDPGKYRVRVDAFVGKRIISREAPLVIRAWPLIRFGTGSEITYPELASFIGTIFFILLSLLFFLLALFVREYWLYLHHIRHVTERHLERFGFIGKRKGVSK